MKVLLTLHHALDANAGAPGVTLALGGALEKAGCAVEYFGWERAFAGERAASDLRRAVRFPWKTAAFLARHAAAFDVIDASTGDAFVWAMRGRPGAQRRHALVTRSHGLEHMVDRAARQEARRGGERLSLKYPIYHGGYRLWEVAQSLRRADHCILLNNDDRQFVHTRLGVPERNMTVLPNGIETHFLGLPPPVAPPPSAPLALAFVGSWIARKGIRSLAAAAALLAQRQVPFILLLLGTGKSEEAVRADLSDAVQKYVQVVPRYQNADLPALLTGQEVLLMPSLAEGFGVALIEAMACGLAAIASEAVGAADAITQNISGCVVPADDDAALAAAVQTLAADRAALFDMRVKAQEVAARFRWDNIAAQTLAVYEQVLHARP